MVHLTKDIAKTTSENEDAAQSSFNTCFGDAVVIASNIVYGMHLSPEKQASFRSQMQDILRDCNILTQSEVCPRKILPMSSISSILSDVGVPQWLEDNVAMVLHSVEWPVVWDPWNLLPPVMAADQRQVTTMRLTSSKSLVVSLLSALTSGKTFIVDESTPTQLKILHPVLRCLIERRFFLINARGQTCFSEKTNADEELSNTADASSPATHSSKKLDSDDISVVRWVSIGEDIVYRVHSDFKLVFRYRDELPNSPAALGTAFVPLRADEFLLSLLLPHTAQFLSPSWVIQRTEAKSRLRLRQTQRMTSDEKVLQLVVSLQREKFDDDGFMKQMESACEIAAADLHTENVTKEALRGVEISLGSYLPYASFAVTLWKVLHRLPAICSNYRFSVSSFVDCYVSWLKGFVTAGSRKFDTAYAATDFIAALLRWLAPSLRIEHTIDVCIVALEFYFLHAGLISRSETFFWLRSLQGFEDIRLRGGHFLRDPEAIARIKILIQHFPQAFNGLLESLERSWPVWEEYLARANILDNAPHEEVPVSETPDGALSGSMRSNLSSAAGSAVSFQSPNIMLNYYRRFVLWRVLRPSILTKAAHSYISCCLGSEFLSSFLSRDFFDSRLSLILKHDKDPIALTIRTLEQSGLAAKLSFCSLKMPFNEVRNKISRAQKFGDVLLLTDADFGESFSDVGLAPLLTDSSSETTHPSCTVNSISTTSISIKNRSLSQFAHAWEVLEMLLDESKMETCHPSFRIIIFAPMIQSMPGTLVQRAKKFVMQQELNVSDRALAAYTYLLSGRNAPHERLLSEKFDDLMSRASYKTASSTQNFSTSEPLLLRRLEDAIGGTDKPGHLSQLIVAKQESHSQFLNDCWRAFSVASVHAVMTSMVSNWSDRALEAAAQIFFGDMMLRAELTHVFKDVMLLTHGLHLCHTHDIKQYSLVCSAIDEAAHEPFEGVDSLQQALIQRQEQLGVWTSVVCGIDTFAKGGNSSNLLSRVQLIIPEQATLESTSLYSYGSVDILLLDPGSDSASPSVSRANSSIHRRRRSSGQGNNLQTTSGFLEPQAQYHRSALLPPPAPQQPLPPLAVQQQQEQQQQVQKQKQQQQQHQHQHQQHQQNLQQQLNYHSNLQQNIRWYCSPDVIPALPLSDAELAIVYKILGHLSNITAIRFGLTEHGDHIKMSEITSIRPSQAVNVGYSKSVVDAKITRWEENERKRSHVATLAIETLQYMVRQSAVVAADLGCIEAAIKGNIPWTLETLDIVHCLLRNIIPTHWQDVECAEQPHRVFSLQHDPELNLENFDTLGHQDWEQYQQHQQEQQNPHQEKQLPRKPYYKLQKSLPRFPTSASFQDKDSDLSSMQQHLLKRSLPLQSSRETLVLHQDPFLFLTRLTNHFEELTAWVSRGCKGVVDARFFGHFQPLLVAVLADEAERLNLDMNHVQLVAAIGKPRDKAYSLLGLYLRGAYWNDELRSAAFDGSAASCTRFPCLNIWGIEKMDGDNLPQSNLTTARPGSVDWARPLSSTSHPSATSAPHTDGENALHLSKADQMTRFSILSIEQPSCLLRSASAEERHGSYYACPVVDLEGSVVSSQYYGEVLLASGSIPSEMLAIRGVALEFCAPFE